MKNIRICALILVAVTMLSFVSCTQEPVKTTGNAQTGEQTATGTQVGTEVVTTEEKEATLDIPEDAYYEGYEFRILGLSNGVYSSNDLVADESKEDVLNDAVYERNNILNEELGITITQTLQTSANIVSTIKNNVSANTDAYDLCIPIMTQAVSLARDDCLHNLYEVPNLDLTKPWWDQNVPQTLTIKDKLYFTTGDISYLDDDLVFVKIFNKDALAEKRPDIDIYQMVRDKKWTLGALNEIIRDLNEDLDGDGVEDIDDYWGMCLNYNDVTIFYQSAGEVMVGPDGEGGFEFAMDGARAMDVAADCFDFMLDNRFFRTDTLNASGDDELNKFMEGSIVFRSTVFYVARQLRPMEMDFGILPNPLYDEDQERYYTPVSYAMTGHCIPTSVSDIERTSTILEAMAYYSYKYLTPAYYDVSLDGVLARDDESKEMLDILFGSKIYDIGWIYNFSNMYLTLGNLVLQNSKAFASAYDSIRDKVNAEIEAVVADFEF